jgi:hypothetical protein
VAKFKQLTISVQNYESAYGALPPAAPSCTTEAWKSAGTEIGNECVGPNWAMQIAGFMEEFELFENVKNCAEVSVQLADDCERFQVGAKTQSYMLCPSAPKIEQPHESLQTALENLAKGNYAACLGSSTYLHSIDRNRIVEDRLARELNPREYASAVKSRGAVPIVMIPNWERRFKF